MRNFQLIFLNEIKSYFTSPVAYVVITIFLIITGYFFYSLLGVFSMVSFQAETNPMLARQYNLLNLNESVVRPLFGNISMIMLLMTPLLTMRLLAEEKKSGTMELLLTFPVKDIEVLLGKFFASLGVFSVMLIASLIFPILLFYLGEPELGPIITGYIGLFLLGTAFISLGIFTSSLTENQIIAATISFGVLLLFWLLSYSKIFASPGLAAFISYVAITDHLDSLAKGVLDTEDLIYYLNFTLVFLFLTLRSIESRRWRG